MVPPDEKPPKPILNPIGTSPLTQRERLEREQAEMQERLRVQASAEVPPKDQWDWSSLMLVGGCITAGAVILFLVVYFFLF